MTPSGPKDLPRSVLDRLRHLSRTRNEDFNLLLNRYAVERLLYRLSQSEYKSRFVLKGAMLFVVWTGRTHRPTRDVDLLGFGDPSLGEMANVFRNVCAVSVEPDAIDFDPASVRAEEIRDAQEYNGVRIHLIGAIGSAAITLRVDIGFGDAITPNAAEVEFAPILDMPAPVLLAYPPETVVAEKLEAIVKLGIANSRMKDFYDLWILSRERRFDLDSLAEAAQSTFARRQTRLADDWPIGLTEEFGMDTLKLSQWKAFLNVHGFTGPKAGLADVIDCLRLFAGPVLGLAEFAGSNWPPGGPWRERSV